MNVVTRKNSQAGFSLIEVLVAMALMSVVSLGITYSTISTYMFTKRNIRNSIASQLALDKVEQLAGLDPSTLTSSNNTTESSVVSQNISFSRTTTITVNSNGSRTVMVTVQGNKAKLGGKAVFTTTLPLWGNS